MAEPTQVLTDIGRLSRERRRSLHLTQEEVADLAGCSPRFIRSLEGGKSTVRVDKLLAVLEVLGLEMTTRIKGSP